MPPKKEVIKTEDKPISYTKEQMGFIQNQYAPGADITTLQGLVAEASEKGMNVFKGECHFVEYTRWDKSSNGYVSKWSVQTSIDFYRKVGMGTGAIDWIECKPYFIDQNSQHTEWMNIEKAYPSYPHYAICEIKRKDMEKPIRTVVYWKEYVKTKQDGTVMGMWARMPGNQLCKCAETACWRRACPDKFAGLYSIDEMDKFVSENQQSDLRKAPDIVITNDPDPAAGQSGNSGNGNKMTQDKAVKAMTGAGPNLKLLPKQTPESEPEPEIELQFTIEDIVARLIQEVSQIKSANEGRLWREGNEDLADLDDLYKAKVFAVYEAKIDELSEGFKTSENPKVNDLIKIIMSMKGPDDYFYIKDGHEAKEFASFLFAVKNTRAIPKDRLEKALAYYSSPGAIKFMVTKYLEFVRSKPGSPAP